MAFGNIATLSAPELFGCALAVSSSSTLNRNGNSCPNPIPCGAQRSSLKHATSESELSSLSGGSQVYKKSAKRFKTRLQSLERISFTKLYYILVQSIPKRVPE